MVTGVTGSTDGFRRILVAHDFSPSATAALREAVWIARQGSSQIVVAHVIDDLAGALSATLSRSRGEIHLGDEEALQRELRRESEDKLRRTIEELGATGLDITHATLLGEPHVRLVHAVQQEHYDLIVVGTRGHSAWVGLFVGSTARRLIRYAPCSVWVVKRREPQPLRSLLVATDMSDASRQALRQAAWLAGKSGAALHLVHVVESADVPESVLGLPPPGSQRATVRQWIEDQANQLLEDVAKECATQAPSIERHLVWGSPAQEIVSLARRVGAGLVAMGSVGRTGMQGLLVGNTAENVLMQCDCDVLTAKPSGFVSPIAPAFWPLHPGRTTPGDQKTKG